MATVIETAAKNGRTENADVQDYAYTGPDTIAGKYMRLYWQPVAVSRQLQAGRAKPITIMSEQFTLYRGQGGTPHVVAFRCAHRGTQLSTGWVEDDCLRCFYHGWKYDGSGQCVEQPAEDGGFAQKIRIASYPTQEYLGLIWAYLGPGEPPPFRRFPQLEVEAEDIVRITMGGNVQRFNYTNNLENDPAHVPFVHRGTEFFEDIPQVRGEETEYGSVETVSTTERGDIGWVHRVMPNTRCFTIALPEGDGWAEFMLWLVPVDDQSHLGFGVIMNHASSSEAKQRLTERMKHWQNNRRDEVPEIAARILRGEMTLADVDEHNLLQAQDAVSQGGQGVIRDRVNERLGRSDAGLIVLRRIWERELRNLAEGKPLKHWVVPERLELDPNYHG